jgi:hypothetical protein
MTDNTIALAVKPKVEDEIRAETVRILRDALAQAESGEVVAALVVLKYQGGTWTDERSGVMDFPDAVGRIEIIKQSWIRDYLDGKP